MGLLVLVFKKCLSYATEYNSSTSLTVFCHNLSHVQWSVCACVCVLGTPLSHIKAEAIVMQNGGQTHVCLRKRRMQIGANWRIRTNDPCAAANAAFCEITVASYQMHGTNIQGNLRKK